MVCQDRCEKLNWPAQSRDLNPIKHLWDELERQLRARPNRPTSVMLFLLTLDGVCRVSILSCLLLACSYVGSLYWDTAVPVHTAVCQYVIKRRFTTVLVVSALSPPVLKAWADWVGITVSCKDRTKPQHTSCFSKLPQVLGGVCGGPGVAAELVFRACMLPMLVPCTGPTAATFIVPLFFGMGRAMQKLVDRPRLVDSNIFLPSLSSGHLVGPVLCQSFCSSMGLPPISSALEHPQCCLMLFSYLLGVILFLNLLFPLTDPLTYVDQWAPVLLLGRISATRKIFS
uniref:Uncharacterized protein n=1 Tax=Hucho hucho TaxID=62062 RepID=A0A4W5N3X9_9TELE